MMALLVSAHLAYKAKQANQQSINLLVWLLVSGELKGLLTRGGEWAGDSHSQGVYSFPPILPQLTPKDPSGILNDKVANGEGENPEVGFHMTLHMG